MALTQAIVFLSTLVALSLGCCTPDQWEGVQVTSGAYARLFRHGLIREYNYVAYDYTGKRSTVFMKYINGDAEARLQYLTHFYEDCKCGQLYVVDLEKHKCWTRMVKGEFRKACIPKDAKKLGDAYLGLKGGFKVSTYESVCPVGKGKVLLTVQNVKGDVCAPVGEEIIGEVYHYDIMNTVSFLDITPGIKNETIFDKPKDCKENWDDFEHDIEFDRAAYILAV